MRLGLADLFSRLPPNVQRPLKQQWYEHISSRDRDADMTFMNYGWEKLDPATEALPLHPGDEPNRYCIQLYHRVASAVDLRGLDVLEVGCGRGGGASYAMRYLEPRSLTGLDLTAASVAFCQEHHTIPGLSFVRGSAEELEFGEGTFDVVLNVESSHCYADMGTFLRGVHRVLKPGGHFLFADFRDRDQVGTLRQQLEDAGLVVLTEKVINAHVVKALELDDARKQALIERKVPRVLRGLFNEFAGMQGTLSSYAALRSGERVYLRFVLRKPVD